MAKRVRASRSAHRPGGQGPSRSRKTSDTPTPATAPVLSAAPEAAIDDALMAVETEPAEVEYAELTLDEQPAPAAPPPSTTKGAARRARRARQAAKTKADSLEARVAAENVYVRQDLRRIASVSGILFIGLAVAWVLFVAVDLLSLY